MSKIHFQPDSEKIPIEHRGVHGKRLFQFGAACTALDLSARMSTGETTKEHPTARREYNVKCARAFLSLAREQ